MPRDIDTPAADADGPSAADLAAIEAERPLIEAEVRLVDAEIRVLTAEPHPTDLDWKRLRAAEREVARVALALVSRHSWPVADQPSADTSAPRLPRRAA